MKKTLNDSPLLGIIFHFITDLREVSGISVRSLCSSSHVSSCTFAKITKKQPVKGECYLRLLEGISYAVNEEEFVEHWGKLGQELYLFFSER